MSLKSVCFAAFYTLFWVVSSAGAGAAIASWIFAEKCPQGVVCTVDCFDSPNICASGSQRAVSLLLSLGLLFAGFVVARFVLRNKVLGVPLLGVVAFLTFISPIIIFDNAGDDGWSLSVCTLVMFWVAGAMTGVVNALLSREHLYPNIVISCFAACIFYSLPFAFFSDHPQSAIEYLFWAFDVFMAALPIYVVALLTGGLVSWLRAADIQQIQLHRLP
jgi:hypothetical protein